jgi:1-acyl-sn-glycerol-3-phosphate acyltransferase
MGKKNEMKVVRNNKTYWVTSNVFGKVLRAKNKVKISGSGVPKKGPALILFNHNEIPDLGYEGLGFKYFGRNDISYGMKNTLWFQSFLKKACGGVALARPEDYGIYDGMDEDLRVAMMTELYKVNRPAMKYIKYLLTQCGEMFALHPEGTRGKTTDIGPVDTSLIKYISKLRKKVDGGISLVYGGIHRGTEGLRPEVTVKFRKGDWNVSDLEGTIQQEFSDLSGYPIGSSSQELLVPCG